VNDGGTPKSKNVPLPSRVQYLNVIAGVFSGMARAIIRNSNDASVKVAKSAIDRYVEDRNQYFLKHPRHAAKKLGGKERTGSRFDETLNCKDPRD